MPGQPTDDGSSASDAHQYLNLDVTDDGNIDDEGCGMKRCPATKRNLLIQNSVVPAVFNTASPVQDM